MTFSISIKGESPQVNVIGDKQFDREAWLVGVGSEKGVTSDPYSIYELPYVRKSLKKALKKYSGDDFCFALCDKSGLITEMTPRENISIPLKDYTALSELDYHNSYSVTVLLTREQTEEVVTLLKSAIKEYDSTIGFNALMVERKKIVSSEEAKKDVRAKKREKFLQIMSDPKYDSVFAERMLTSHVNNSLIKNGEHDILNFQMEYRLGSVGGVFRHIYKLYEDGFFYEEDAVISDGGYFIPQREGCCTTLNAVSFSKKLIKEKVIPAFKKQGMTAEFFVSEGTDNRWGIHLSIDK